MEETLKDALSEAIRQVPGLVVLTVVVWIFVKVIFRFIKHIEDRGKIFENLHREHMEERAASRQVLSGVTIAIKALTVVVERLRNLDQ